jgi:hypothetical protein
MELNICHRVLTPKLDPDSPVIFCERFHGEFRFGNVLSAHRFDTGNFFGKPLSPVTMFERKIAHKEQRSLDS